MSGRRSRKVELVELNDRDRRVLARRHPEVSGHTSALVVVTSAEVREAFVDAVRQLADALNDGERLQVERLVDVLAPRVDVPTPRMLERARQEALLRTRLLRDFGACTSQQLAELGGSAAGNRSQLAYRWRRDHRIFGVNHQGTTWYLGFQFDDAGQPLSVIASVLERLGAWPEWEIAAWFVRENGMLDRRRPLDLLTDDPGQVVAAATYDAGRPEAPRHPAPSL